MSARVSLRYNLVASVIVRRGKNIVTFKLSNVGIKFPPDS